MRSITLFSTLLLSVIIAVGSATLYFFQPPIVGVEYGGINPGNQPVKLLAKADYQAQEAAWLAAGEFFVFQHSGISGRWHYVKYRDQALVIHSSRIQLGFVRIHQRWLLSARQLIAISYSALGLVILLLRAPLKNALIL